MVVSDQQLLDCMVGSAMSWPRFAGTGSLTTNAYPFNVGICALVIERFPIAGGAIIQ